MTPSLERIREQRFAGWQLIVVSQAVTADQLATAITPASQGENRIALLQSPDGLAAALNAALQQCAGAFFVFLEAGDLLPPHALSSLHEAMLREPACDIWYSDEDELDPAGNRCRPHFKTAWDPDLILSRNYVGRVCAIRTALVGEVGGFRPGLDDAIEWDLLLRVSALTQAQRIRHVPLILCHRRQVSTTTSEPSSLRVVADFLRTTGHECRVTLDEKTGSVRVVWPIPDPAPLVSIIIPTRDRLDLLRPCIEGVLEKTDYPNAEIIIVDNDSVEWATLDYFHEITRTHVARILPYPGKFNYSAINNAAVGTCRGSIVCFLNNDIEVISPDWLREMVSHAVRPEVGVVGARLLYGNRRLQHGGVILGLLGGVDHAFRFLPDRSSGYDSLAKLTRNVSCVTAACMVMRRSLFEQVGGFDEQHLQIAYNDIDLCLKVKQQGYRVIYDANATLFHHESISRGIQINPDLTEMKYFSGKWGHLLMDDPFYNSNLSLSNDYRLAWPPRVARPWQEASR